MGLWERVRRRKGRTPFIGKVEIKGNIFKAMYVDEACCVCVGVF